MLGQLSQKKRGLRDKLRQHQLNQQFSQIRGSLSTPSPPQAVKSPNTQRQLLEQTLKSIKRAIQTRNYSNLHSFLVQLKSIAQNYNVIQCLATPVLLPVNSDEVQFGLLPVQCTWVEILSFLLNREENTKLQKTLLRILRSVLYQLRLSMTKLRDLAVELLKELIKSMPYRLAQSKNYQMWAQLCQYYGEALISAEMLVIEQTLLAEPSPLIEFFYRVAAEYDFFQIAEARISFIEASLLVVAIQNSSTVPQLSIEDLKEFVCGLLMENFNFHEVQASRNYEYLKVFVLNGGRLANSQISMLESLAHKQTYWSPKYYQLLNCILCFHSYVLETQTVAILFNHILRQGCGDLELFQTKKWMILALKQHLTNRGNEWAFQEARLIREISDDQSQLQRISLNLQSNGEQILLILEDLLQKAGAQPTNGILSKQN